MKDKTTIQKLFSFSESQHLQKIKKINFEETFLQEETYQIQRKHWLNKNGIWNVSWLCAWFQTWRLSNLSHFNACEACDKYHGFVLGASDSTTHFFKYKLRFSGIKVKSDSFCPRFNFVLSPKSDLLWLYSIFNGTFYCKWTFWIRHHKDTLIALIELIGKIFINLKTKDCESFQMATLIYVEPLKTRAKKI